jgi:hypothetical protein
VADTKDLLAQAVTALDAERALSAQKLDSMGAANIALQATVDAQQQTNAGLNKTIADQSAQLTANAATIADLKAQLAKYQPAPQPEPPQPVVVTAAVTTGTLANAGINAAIALAQPGQTVRVPAGKYQIDATKPPMLKGGVNYDFTGAQFVVQPNSAPRYYAFKTGAGGGTIKGGEVIGDRLQHTYTAGSTHEWGYGLSLTDGWKVDGMTCRQMTGDGFGVSGDNVEMRNCIGTQNRRQGVSVFACKGFRAYDCQFNLTGAYGTQAGTSPMAGIDFEPDSGSVVDAKLYRCDLSGNRAGALAWLRSTVSGTIDVELVDCTVSKNSNGVWAKDEAARPSTVKVRVTQTDFAGNSGNSVKADSGSVVTVGDTDPANANTFNGGTSPKTGIATKYDIAQLNGGKAVVGVNKYP